MKKFFLMFALVLGVLMQASGAGWTSYPTVTTLQGPETFLTTTVNPTNNQQITASNLSSWVVSSSGVVDPLAANYISNRKITDLNSQNRIKAFVSKLRGYTNLPIFHYDFNLNYNPTSHIDLFGNTNNYSIGTETYSSYGLWYHITNGFVLVMPTNLTNFTVFINRRNTLIDLVNTPNTFENLNNGVNLDYSFEKRGSSNGHYFAGSSAFTLMRCWQTDGTNFAGNKNFNTQPPSLLCYQSLKAGDCVAPQSYQSIYCHSSDCNGNENGYIDIMPMTNLQNGGATNFGGFNEIHFGISTNWNKWQSLGWNSVTTNGFGEIFSVTVYAEKVNYNMVTNYFAANAELQIDDNWQFFVGTSMMQERANRQYTSTIDPTYAPGLFTNCWPYMVWLSHPQWNWRNYSQGGSSMATYTNWISSGKPFPLETMIKLLYNGRRNIEVVSDYPRNDTLNTNSFNFNLIGQGMVNTFLPIKLAGATFTAVESVFPSSDSVQTTTPSYRRFLECSNLWYSALNVRTNTGSLCNKIVPFSTYFTGNLLSTNSRSFIGDGAGGYHIEGTNSTSIFIKQAFLFNTGTWPDNNPSWTSDFISNTNKSVN